MASLGSPPGQRRIAAALTALIVGALLCGCSASRPAVCDPGDGTNRNVQAFAGRVLIGVAEVVVGAELVDRHGDVRRGCNDVATREGAYGVVAPPAVARDRPQTSVASIPPEQPVTPKVPDRKAASKAAKRPAVGSQGGQLARALRSATPPAIKAEAVQVRPGRWILIRKTARTLSVFDDDHRLKTYSVVLGADPVDPKRYEGDRRTPEGKYHVIAKNVHQEWQRFLLLDYPNAEDREAYGWSRTKGLVPVRGGQVAGTGGSIGIHGTADDELNRHGVNWTYGCISLRSRDVQELYGMVPVGTPVVIEH